MTDLRQYYSFKIVGWLGPVYPNVIFVFSGIGTDMRCRFRFLIA